MKKTLQIILIIFWSFNGYSQCPTETVRLTSQTAIDSFPILYPNCTSGDYTIIVSDLYQDSISDITNLQGLSAIEKVSKNLSIVDTKIESLEGLENLKTVGVYLYLTRNEELTDISDLQSIDSIGSIIIDSNLKLENYSAFNQLTDCHGLYIQNNSTLKDLTSLPKINVLERLDISSCDSLVSFEGVDYPFLRALGIIDNNMLTHLNGLSGIRELEKLDIFRNEHLIDLQGLDSLETISFELFLLNNPSLESLEGVDQLESIDNLRIHNNNKLKDLNGLQSLKTINSSLAIIDNDSLVTLSGLENAGSGSGGWTFYSEDCYFYFGNNEYGLIIESNPALESIEALSNLSHVAGELVVIDNDKLNDLKGLENIESVFSTNVDISYNESLKDVDALDNINEIGIDNMPWRLNISNNPMITSLDKIFDLTSNPQCLLSISNNENLTSINGPIRPTQLEYLTLSNNPNLENLDFFQDLTELNGLNVSGTKFIENLDALSNLNTAVTSIRLWDNSLLSDISGLSGIIEIQPFDCDGEISNGYLTIKGNPLLSECAIMPICDALISQDVTKFIEENGLSCSSPEDINCDEVSISGFVFYDSNQNGILDVGENGISSIGININPPDRTVLTKQGGKYIQVCEEGIEYEINFPELDNYSLTTATDQYTIVFEQGNALNYNNNFGIYPDEEIHYVVSNISSNPTRCNTRVKFFLSMENLGTYIENGMLRVDFDSLSAYSWSNPKADSINLEDNFLLWDIEEFTPFDFENIILWFDMPDETNTGAVINFTSSVIVDSMGTDIVTSEYTYSPTVLCSYDPNDKLVMPAGVQEENYTLKDEKLTYTVRFQNTGNAPAIDVKIIDTLDNLLDIESFRVVNSSHSLQTFIDDREVTFLFKNINLVDSLTDERNSHGFVTYEIEAVADILDNSKIENTAHIIFDFNPPIVTNTVDNTMVTTIPTTALTEQLIELHKVYPNPISPNQELFVMCNLERSTTNFDICITNNLGQKLLCEKGENGLNKLDIKNVLPGIYFISLENKEGLVGTSKIVIEK